MKRGRNLFAVGLLALAVTLGLMNFGDVNAATLTTRLLLQINADFATALDLNTATAPLSYKAQTDLSSGVAANQADVIWADQRTLSASATESLDLKGGGLVDAFGTAINPVKLRGIIITAASTNTNNVVVGNDTNHVPFLSAVTSTVTIQPNGTFVLTAPALAGIAVTAGTGDIIKVTNGGAGTSVTYNIILLGTSS